VLGLTDDVGDFDTGSVLTLHGFTAKRLRWLSVADYSSAYCSHYKRQISLRHGRQVVLFVEN